MSPRRLGLAILLPVVLALGLVACAGPGDGGDGDSASGQITLYTSVPQPIIDKIQADFMSEFPEIELIVFRSGTSAVVSKLAAEQEAGDIQADLVWVAEPSTYEDFKDQDLLLQFTPEEADALPDAMKDPEGYYYAGRVINMIIGYSLQVEDPPTGWMDMIDPAYSDQLGFPSPLRSGAAQAASKTLVDNFGWEYFDDFAEAGGIQVRNNSTARDQLASGELMVSALLDYIVRGAIEDGMQIDYIWPEEGTVVIPSPIAIFASTDNAAAAQVFVDYALSAEGQRTLVELGNFIPVRPDVDPPPDTPSFDEIERLPTDWDAVQAGRQELNDRWIEMFGELEE